MPRKAPARGSTVTTDHLGVGVWASLLPPLPESQKGREMIPIERLRNVEIFRGLKDEELAIVARFCQEESVPQGITLVQEGARADKLFILEEGVISIRFEKGTNYTVQGPGKILGWSFLVPPNRYTASVITITPSRLLVIKGPDFYDLVHKETRMGLKIMDNLAQVVASRLKVIVDYH